MSHARTSSLRFGYLGAIAAVVGALLFELLAPRAATPAPGTPASEASSPGRVVLTLDTSGSMQREGKLEEMSRAAQSYLERQNWKTTRVAVVSFDSGANLLSPLSNDPVRLHQSLAGITANGATEMDVGLQRAAEALSAESDAGVRRSILLFTDGTPDSEFRSRDQVRNDTLQAARNLRDSGVRIVAVATLDADLGFLGQLTGDSALVFPASSGSFDAAFQRADQAIKGLFRTGGRGGSPVGDALLLGGLVALCLGAALLVAENVWGLRGRWWRDLSWVPLGAAVLGAVGALVGQGLYAILPDAPTSRAWGWALLGIAAGWMLGLADRSRAKSLRGALGGFAGGFIGGFAFDLLSGLNFGGGDTGALPRLLSSAVLGFAIGLMVQLAQQAFKSAWLTGITTGPYEGKQYILAKQTVSVGRSDGNDIGLYREKDLPLKAGSFAFSQGQWTYQGEAVPINGTPTSSAPVSSGDTIRFGQTEFLFEERGKVMTQTPAALEAESSTPATSPASVPVTPTSPLSSPEPKPVPPPVPSPAVSSPAPKPASVIPIPAPAAPALSERWRLVGDQVLELPTPPARVTLGRGDDNTLVLHEPSVSSHHALLEVKVDAVLVTDLGSTNGVIVNEARIAANTPTGLHVGDRVQFGTMKFTVRN
jgi:pSer/pThr/pTyr-binding forkhead associated (FHA) protein/uncharacterized protein YegL